MDKQTMRWADAAIRNMQTIEHRDKFLEDLWSEFADVPFDEDADGRMVLCESWLGFEIGTEREDIWHWFDERYSRGVGYLLYNDGVDRTNRIGMLLYYSELCDDCETLDCAYNSAGECRYPMVHHRVPVITEEDGCTEGVIRCS